MSAEKQQDLFFIRRNTNRNEVRYAIRSAGEPALPLGKNPVVVYWQMFEKGPDITEPITLFEQMAFGIASQEVDGNTTLMKLTGLPQLEIRIEQDTTDPQKFKAFTKIAGDRAELTDFYVHAEPGLLMPQVKYVEIRGLRDGKLVTERIQK